MNSKDYVNDFPELASYPHDERIALLEQARYQAFTRMGLAGKSALFMILSWLIAFSFPAVAFLIFEFGIVVNSLAIGIGAVVSFAIHKKLNGLLLKQGLDKVLAE